jgi:hypothetical protein
MLLSVDDIEGGTVWGWPGGSNIIGIYIRMDGNASVSVKNGKLVDETDGNVLSCGWLRMLLIAIDKATGKLGGERFLGLHFALHYK